MVIYKIINIINKKFYIGSCLSFDKRKYRHIRDLEKNSHHSIHLQNAWNKYGKENFIFEIIEIIENKKLLLKREQYYLNKLKSWDRDIGYNIYKDVSGPSNYTHSKHTKEKLSRLWMKKYKEGYIHPMLGKKHSEETKKKQSIIKIEKYKKKKHPRKGKKHNKETIEKIIEKNKGKNSPMFGKKGERTPSLWKTTKRKRSS